MKGVFNLTKKTSAVFAAGDPVWYDGANHWCDVATATFVGPVGSALAAAGATATTVEVLLTQAPVAVSA